MVLTLAGPLAAEETEPEDVQLELDEVSVTATRIERKTAEVPASVTVIDSEAIDATKQFNIKEALIGTPGVLIESGNQGYDSRLIIRGAGLKAPYGVREIMVLRDGVPVTDPDSFTRLDMIDTQLIERIEVVKGPNSTLWGANAAGGVINIISKSPLERSGGDLRLQAGEYDTRGYHFSYADDVAEKLYYLGSISRRESDNSWRRWNEFSTTQASLQPAVVLEDGSVWENMISYSKADLQLPGSLNEEQFKQYRRTGAADETDGPWQYSGRYSKSYFFSSKLTKEIGEFEFIPLVYLNTWEHHHPVTGRINDADTTLGGADLQMNYRHALAGMQGTLTSGVTGRFDDQDTDYYKYAEFSTIPGPSGRISAVLSDNAGDLQEVETRETMLWGVYLQESLRPTDRTILDIGLRYDSVDFDIKSTSWGEYNWSRGKYIDFAAPVEGDVDKQYDAVSPRIGLSYKLIDTLHVFASASSGVQTPTEGEISENPDLDLVKVKSYETGLKGRGKIWSFDTAIYYSPVKNEVAKVLQGGITEYVNAGETDKRGFEFAGTLGLLPGLTLDGGYSYTDYIFEEFSEPVGYGAAAVNMDRGNNQLPYVPRHQYSLGLRYRHESGFKCSVLSTSWGSYYMDNANTEKYDGYDFVTSLMAGYEWDHFDFRVNVENLFDKQFANEVTKDTSGVVKYTPAAPQTVIARIDYRF
ncbi:MAG: TonB-dependent receptor [Deltaproteobacteria bacterium]|nr:TonB-dependent receptor [Deltaproteobacteria bacterium]